MENKKYKKDDNAKKCFICNGNFEYFLTHFDSYLKTSNKKYDIYKCVKCGLLKILPEPILEEIKTFYPKEYYSFNSTANSIFLERIKDEILRVHYKTKIKSLPMRLLAYIFINSIRAVPLDYPKHNGKFLDIGCGDGYWLDKLEKYDWDCTGVEFIGKDNKKIRIGNFLEMDFKEKYEFIRMSHVLEHVVNPEKYLLKIKSLLDDRGECHISLPNTDSACCKIFGRYWFGLDIPRHIQNFSYKNLKVAIEKNGLKVKRVKYNSRGSFGSCIMNFFNILFNKNITDRFYIFTAVSVLIDKFFDMIRLGDSITVIIENKYV
jgi:SAM-dependent methyltransferase